MVKNAEKASYQKLHLNDKETQFELLKKLELRESDFIEVQKHCKKLNIPFLSTAFDNSSLKFLSSLDMPYHKIPSGEITNLPLLRNVAKSGKPIIMSTGMANINEVDNALQILRAFNVKNENIILLHCTSQYPALMGDVNLSAMITMKEKFGLDVGYSDHTMGIEIPIAAVAMGARVIEKHFTLDRNMEGPDHMASIEPCELKNMVSCIRNIEMAIGNGIKKPSKVELENLLVVRKSICAKKNILKGEKLSEQNLTVKRPGSGVSPMLWDQIIGKTARSNFKKDELIKI